MISGADIMVKCLQAEGIDTIFGYRESRTSWCVRSRMLPTPRADTRALR